MTDKSPSGSLGKWKVAEIGFPESFTKKEMVNGAGILSRGSLDSIKYHSCFFFCFRFFYSFFFFFFMIIQGL